jgi:hypothetical protein
MGERDYEKFLEYNPGLKEVVPKSFWDYAVGTGDYTQESLGEQWYQNLKKNLKRLYPKHGSVPEVFGGIGKNKAVIGVGAGPSFNKNKDALKTIYERNLQFLVKDQPFLIIASNHQYKPMLEMGIFPHFVFIIEGGEHVYDQLCTDVPELGKNSILFASLDTNHKILSEWDKQGKAISFFLPGGKQNKKIFKKRTKQDPEPLAIATGGNVFNGIVRCAYSFLKAPVFMAVGNDLSFEASKELDDRRKSFYADEDYSSNIGSDRDEAKDELVWMGIEFEDCKVHPSGKKINLKPVMTSRQFLVYKTWLELHIGVWAPQEIKFRYYNCTEGGISGVVSTEHSKEAFKDINRWKLMDEVVPGRWFTTTLLDAANQWMEFLEKCRTQMEIEQGAGGLGMTGGNVIALPQGTDGARIIVPPGKKIISPPYSGIIT